MRKYHSIKQFRDIIEAVRHRTQFVKVLDNGDVEYDTSRKLPTLTFEGQVKLHGTNASVGLMPDGEVVCQS